MLRSWLRGGSNAVEQKADTTLELVGDEVELVRRLRLADAPVERVRGAGELRADLAHAVAERDDVVEAVGLELAQVLRAPPRDPEAAVAHHAHRLGAERLRVAARAACADRAAGALLDEGLRELRACAVAGAQEQHVRARVG